MSYTAWPMPGTVVYVKFLGFFRHKGVVSDRFRYGKPMVIASSQASNGVVENGWDEFADGKQVFTEGYPSRLSPQEVLWRARSMIGERYSVLTSNCEHFVRRCHGLTPESPQAAAVLLTCAFAMTIFAIGQSKG